MSSQPPISWFAQPETFDPIALSRPNGAAPQLVPQTAAQAVAQKSIVGGKSREGIGEGETVVANDANIEPALKSVVPAQPAYVIGQVVGGKLPPESPIKREVRPKAAKGKARQLSAFASGGFEPLPRESKPKIIQQNRADLPGVPCNKPFAVVERKTGWRLPGQIRRQALVGEVGQISPPEEHMLSVAAGVEIKSSDIAVAVNLQWSVETQTDKGEAQVARN